MSVIELYVVKELLSDYFGEEVSRLGYYAGGEVLINIRDTQRITGLSFGVIKDGLSLLYKHNLLNCRAHVRDVVLPGTSTSSRVSNEFELDVGRALLLLRYPLYLRLEREMRGEVGEEILRSLLVDGRRCMSSCIMKAARKLQKDKQAVGVYDVKKVFLEMVEGGYVERCPRFVGEADLFRDNMPCYSSDEDIEGIAKKKTAINLDATRSGSADEQKHREKYEADKLSYWDMRFQPPNDVNIGLGIEKGNKVGKAARDAKLSRPKKFPDEDLEWRLNPYRYHDYYRIPLTQEIFRNQFGEVGSDVVNLMMTISKVSSSGSKTETPPVPLAYIKRDIKTCSSITSMPSTSSQLIDSDDDDDEPGDKVSAFDLPEILDQLVFNSNGMFSCADRGSGGKFAIHFLKVIKHSGLQILQDIVLSKFGSKACRVFGAFLHTDYLTFEQLVDVVMLSQPKETKALTYELFENCFVDIVEVDSRGTCIMYVNLPLVCRNAIVDFYQTIHNAKVKMEAVKKDKRVLLEKGEQLDKILSTMSSEDAEDEESVQEKIDAIMPSTVRVTLNKARADVKGFTDMMMRYDELILRLQLMMRYVIRYNCKAVTGGQASRGRKRRGRGRSK